MKYEVRSTKYESQNSLRTSYLVIRTYKGFIIDFRFL